jgi:hypothetical protein
MDWECNLSGPNEMCCLGLVSTRVVEFCIEQEASLGRSFSTGQCDQNYCLDESEDLHTHLAFRELSVRDIYAEAVTTQQPLLRIAEPILLCKHYWGKSIEQCSIYIGLADFPWRRDLSEPPGQPHYRLASLTQPSNTVSALAMLPNDFSWNPLTDNQPAYTLSENLICHHLDRLCYAGIWRGHLFRVFIGEDHSSPQVYRQEIPERFRAVAAERERRFEEVDLPEVDLDLSGPAPGVSEESRRFLYRYKTMPLNIFRFHTS